MTALFNELFTKDTVCGLLKYREQHSLKEWVEQWKCSCSYNIMFYSSFYERNSSFLSVLQNNTMFRFSSLVYGLYVCMVCKEIGTKCCSITQANQFCSQYILILFSLFTRKPFF